MTEQQEGAAGAVICSARYLVRIAELLMDAAERARAKPGMEIVLTADDADTISSAICMLLTPVVWNEMTSDKIAGHA